MRGLRVWFWRLCGLFNKERRDRELAEEIESHVQMHIDDNLRAGMTPGEARRQALVKLGGIGPTIENYRSRRGVPALEHLVQDLRYGLRVLWKNPGYTAVAVVTLALGIGANSAIFSVVNAVLLRPLPFPEAGRLVFIWATNTTGNTMDVGSYPDFEDWKAQNRSFEGLAAFTRRGVTLAGSEQAELVEGLQATPGFFEILGASPALGRTFRLEEQEPGRSRVALLSDGLWKRRFAGRADVLGQTIRVNEEIHTIVGVMPPDFRFSHGTPEQIYVPLVRETDRNHGYLHVLGRLNPRVSISAAQAEMQVITERLAKQYPKSNEGVRANLMPLVDALAGNARPGLLLFLGVVALVLLIACANVANLMLARNASRQKELAVRAALGAGHMRLMKQLLTESILLALAGGALGLLLSSWTARLLVALLAQSFPIPRIETTQTDVWVLGFTVAVSLATGILFGAVHALAVTSPELNENLREASRTATTGSRGGRVRGILVIAETALALVLLAGAGLLLKSLLVMRSTAPGFGSENLLTVRFWQPAKKFANAEERWKFYGNILERIRRDPAARSAALVADLPLGGGWDTLGFQIIGRPAPAPRKRLSANFNIVSSGYFRTMAIPVRQGREFTEEDAANTPGVIVINETAARMFWPAEDPLGKQITLNGKVMLTIVGVTGDVRQMGLGIPSRPEIYLNYMQPGPLWPLLNLVVHTTADPVALAGSIKGIAQSVDRDVPISHIRTMDEVLSGSMAESRVYTLLLGVFASLALTLAAVGLYGVVSYTVTRRRHEVGIRMALGAARGDILRLILRQGVGLSIAGTTIGLVCALALTRLLTNLVPGVQPGDPLTLLAVSTLLMLVAFAASYMPARRATRVDPVVTLRSE